MGFQSIHLTWIDLQPKTTNQSKLVELCNYMFGIRGLPALSLNLGIEGLHTHTEMPSHLEVKRRPKIGLGFRTRNLTDDHELLRG